MLGASASLGLDVALPVLVAAVLAAGLATFLQVGPLLTFAPVAPKPERIDPVRGAKNLLSVKQLVDLLQSLVIVLLVAAIAWSTLRDGLRGVVGLAARDASAALGAAASLVGLLVMRVGGALLGGLGPGRALPALPLPQGPAHGQGRGEA